VIGAAPAAAVTVGEEAAARAMAELLAEKVSRRRAARIVSKLTGVPANRLYAGSL
jgi:hypothetical protein